MSAIQRKDGSPCPKCRHGKQGGHNGRQCPVVIGPSNFAAIGYNEYRACGCKHRADGN